MDLWPKKPEWKLDMLNSVALEGTIVSMCGTCIARRYSSRCVRGEIFWNLLRLLCVMSPFLAIAAWSYWWMAIGISNCAVDSEFPEMAQ